MMKLSQYHKDAILNAIMADVPKRDQKTIAGEIQISLVKAMSPDVRKLYKKNPKAIATAYIGDCGLQYNGRNLVAGDADVEEVTKPFKDAEAFYEKTRTKLFSAIKGCNTRKQFIDTFPEFSNYAPPEEGKCSTLPAIANVVSDLIKIGFVPKVTKGVL